MTLHALRLIDLLSVLQVLQRRTLIAEESRLGERPCVLPPAGASAVPPADRARPGSIETVRSAADRSRTGTAGRAWVPDRPIRIVSQTRSDGFEWGQAPATREAPPVRKCGPAHVRFAPLPRPLAIGPAEDRLRCTARGHATDGISRPRRCNGSFCKTSANRRDIPSSAPATHVSLSSPRSWCSNFALKSNNSTTGPHEVQIPAPREWHPASGNRGQVWALHVTHSHTVQPTCAQPHMGPCYDSGPCLSR